MTRAISELLVVLVLAVAALMALALHDLDGHEDLMRRIYE